MHSNHTTQSTTKSGGARRRRGTVIGASAALLLSQFVMMAGAGSVEAAPIGHGQTVSETPRRDLPKVRDGEVLAADRVGDRLVVGGTFTTIERPDGSTVVQPYLAAFDIDTGEFDETFRPQLDGRVQTIEAGEAWDEVFIGGGFKNVDGTTRKYVAKLSTSTGTVDTAWKANATGWVYELTRFEDRLFIGGNFAKVRGQAHSRLAEVDTDRGQLASGFNIDITGQRITGCRADRWCQTSSAGPIVQGLEVTPDGSTLVVMHAGDQVEGLRRWGVALIDISGAAATVRPWNTNFYPSGDFVGITDGALSPDGTYIALTHKVGNFPPYHDTTVRFDVGQTTWNDSDVDPTWVTQNFDSTFAVAISDVAVYIGGHFCWTEGPNSSATGWPGRSGNQYSCYENGGGQFDNTVYRYHQAALDPATGTALEWDSPAINFTGSKLMEVIDRGLLVGHDGDRLGQIDTGRFGFYDLGEAFDTTPPPPPPPADPTCDVTVDGTSATITWTDDTATKWSVRRDGTWIKTVNAPTTTYTDTNPAPGEHLYQLRQSNGAKNTLDCGTVDITDNTPPPTPATCSVTVDGTSATITWTDDTATKWSVRRDGKWIKTVNAPTTTYTDTNPAPGEHLYQLRQSNGAKNTLDCGTVDITDNTPPPTPATCSVTVDGTSATITWTDDTATKWSVRRDGKWIKTVNAPTTTYTDTNPAPGEHVYILRQSNGPKNDLACGTVEIPEPVVEAAAVENEVIVDEVIVDEVIVDEDIVDETPDDEA